MDSNQEAIIKPEVNYEKSLEKHRLIYKISSWGVFITIFNYVLYSFFIGIVCLPIFKQASGSDTPMWLIACSVVITTWMILNIIFKNALVKIEGRNVTADKEEMLETIDVFFSTYDFIINDDKMMRSFKPTGNPIWGTIITIILDGNKMYLNIATLGKSGSPTLIHGLSNYLKAKRIAKYYRAHYQS